MTGNQTTDQEDVPLVVWQPVFDRDKAVTGYDLSVDNTVIDERDGQYNPLAQFLAEYADSVPDSTASIFKGKPMFLTLESETLLEQPSAFGGLENYVVSLVGRAACSSNCIGFAESLQEQGAKVAVDCDADEHVFNLLADKCDILKVSARGKRPADIVSLCRRCKDFKGKLYATEVSDWETFEGMRALGFQFFQGPFFTVPEVKDEVQLQEGSLAKLRLLGELNKPACDMNDLAEIIASDISLSYRILRYINSASFGFRTQIKSINQAVALLGLKELKHWATVVVMADIDSTPKGEELSYMALHRARFLSRFAESNQRVKSPPEVLFMLGLFSKLDALLSYPMDKVLENMPLDDSIKAALCGEENECREYLRMLEAVEAGDCDAAADVLGLYDIRCTLAATEYMKAGVWAAQQLSQMK